VPYRMPSAYGWRGEYSSSAGNNTVHSWSGFRCVADGSAHSYYRTPHTPYGIKTTLLG